MENNFEKALKFVLSHEAEFVDDPNDPGKATKYGISQKAYPDLDIANLTREDAKIIYQRDYWDKAGCGEIANGLDIVVFDTAVNCGVSRALAFLATTHDWRDYLFLRLDHYASLNIAKHYMRGWTQRVFDLWRLVRMGR